MPVTMQERAAAQKEAVCAPLDDLENALDPGARLVEGLLGDPVGADPGEGAVGGLVEGLLGDSVGDLVEGHLGDFGVDPCESV